MSDPLNMPYAAGLLKEDVADDEARLIEALKQRDRKASAELVSRYADAVYSYLRRRLYPHTEYADDLLQDIFLAALNALPRAERIGSLESWLFGVARHKVQQHYRQVLKAPLFLEDGDGPDVPCAEPLLDELLDGERAREQIERILAGLPEHYAAALLWRYWENASAAEMAQRTDKTIKAIERLLARARAEFKRRWYAEA